MTMQLETLRLTTALALTLGLSGCAAVELPQESVPSEDREDNGEQARQLPIFRALDTNDDGYISADEIDAASELLASFDENGDGRLSGNELQPRHRPRELQPRRRPRLMFGSPANLPEGTRAGFRFAAGDNSIEIADLPPEVQNVLSSADTDRDGTASAAELLAMVETQGSESSGEQNTQVHVSLMATFDTNQDGTVSQKEIESATQSLRERDSDADGVISPNELASPKPDGDGHSPNQSP